MTETLVEREDRSIITYDDCRLPLGLALHRGEASRYKEVVRLFKSWRPSNIPPRKKHRVPIRKVRVIHCGEWYEPTQTDTKFIMYLMHSVKSASRRAPLETSLQGIFDEL